jgi:hypothetical protein
VEGEDGSSATIRCRAERLRLPLVAAASAVLLATAPNQAAVARLTAVSAPHAGAFLHAIPLKAIGAMMNDHSLRIAVALRLGTAVSSEHRCLCGAMVDVNGIHGLICRISKGRLERHNAVNKLIKRSLLTPKFRLVLRRSNCHTLTVNDQMVCQQCHGHVDSV